MGDTTAASIARMDKAAEKIKFVEALLKTYPAMPFTLIEECLFAKYGSGVESPIIKAAREKVAPGITPDRKKLDRRPTNGEPKEPIADTGNAIKYLKKVLEARGEACSISVKCDTDGNVTGTLQTWVTKNL